MCNNHSLNLFVEYIGFGYCYPFLPLLQFKLEVGDIREKITHLFNLSRKRGK